MFKLVARWQKCSPPPQRGWRDRRQLILGGNQLAKDKIFGACIPATWEAFFQVAAFKEHRRWEFVVDASRLGVGC